MDEELLLQLKSRTGLIYYLTEEEDRFLLQFSEALGVDKQGSAKVFNAAFGLVGIQAAIAEWHTRGHNVQKDTHGINDALIAIHKDGPLVLDKAPKGQGKVPMAVRRHYIITDPDRWLRDPHVQRRLLNIIQQGHNDTSLVKGIILVGNQLYIPEKLARYIEVVRDRGLTSEEILSKVGEVCGKLGIAQPDDAVNLFRGLTSYEIRSALIQSYRRNGSSRCDAKDISKYRQQQLLKTGLVKYIDTSANTLESLGGLQRFKQWAIETKAVWTPEGQAFGLRPPKGVIAVGIWGSGKSVSTKMLGNIWGVPVLQVDFGRLRQPELGTSESNVYRVLALAEAAAPCILWIDEGEKSFSGGEQSTVDGGVAKRMLGIFSTWQQETTAPVCVVITANNLASMPVEVVNRADDRWFFTLPTQDDLVDIIKIHLLAKGQDPSEYYLAELAQRAKGLVGREVEQAVKAALTKSFVAGHPKIDEGILADILKRKPRLLHTMGDEVKALLDWVGYDPEGNDGIKARFASDPEGEAKEFVVE